MTTGTQKCIYINKYSRYMNVSKQRYASRNKDTAIYYVYTRDHVYLRALVCTNEHASKYLQVFKCMLRNKSACINIYVDIK